MRLAIPAPSFQSSRPKFELVLRGSRKRQTGPSHNELRSAKPTGASRLRKPPAIHHDACRIDLPRGVLHVCPHVSIIRPSAQHHQVILQFVHTLQDSIGVRPQRSYESIKVGVGNGRVHVDYDPLFQFTIQANLIILCKLSLFSNSADDRPGRVEVNLLGHWHSVLE